MGKYDPLRDYLMQSGHREFELTFCEIDSILEPERLPKCAKRPQFWGNTRGPSRHTQRRAWGAAGYDAFPIRDARRVKFRRATTDNTRAPFQ
jgi:hypothetical protein